MIIEDRWYQAEAEQSVFNYFQSGNKGNPIVAMPTGTGKSLVIARLVKRILAQWPNQRVMMLTHVKELIEQNANKLMQHWSVAPMGIYSAGLNSRDMILPIIFGGIQSVANTIKKFNAENANMMLPPQMQHFGWRDLIFVDECHLISPNEQGQYNYVINELKKINPYLKVIGFSATPFRLKQGMLTDKGGIFTDICFDITDYSSFNRLIDEGFLATLIPKPTNTKIDLSEVGLQAGEFNNKQLNAAVDKDEITYQAVREIAQHGENRRSWAVFSTGIENSEHIAAMLQSFGVVAVAVHSKLTSKENDQRLAAYKRGEIRCVVSNNKITTGFDHPEIDLIGMLRPTLSPGLWVQMLGRGTRPAKGKENCLVLDFAGNTPRLGPINDPIKPVAPGKKKPGDAPVKICDQCGVYNHGSVRFCISCNNPFEFKGAKLFATAGTDVLVKSDAPLIEFLPVNRVTYNRHEKRNKEGVLLSPPSIKVSYYCGLRMFTDWICLEHNGLPGKKARDWWRQHHSEEPPVTTQQALQKVSELRTPKLVRVWLNKKYPEVLGVEF